MAAKEEELQQTIENYWTGSAEGYSGLIKNELSSFRKDAWRNKILANAPRQECLEILDIGTGPGFFPIILGEAGHRLTAVDCTEKMLAEARNNAAVAGVKAGFYQMDSHSLDFPDNSFDLIVNRNVTWTLYDPSAAYREWQRVLRVGGKLLIFDANWGRYCFDEEIRQQNDKNAALYRKKYGEPPKTNKADEEYIDQMFLSSRLRPDWDIEALRQMGFAVSWEKDVTGELWGEPEQLLYGATPMFMVVGEKQ
ncbi:class I SAM-dependent methyltransferase [Desulfosporosinus youngiae]|uniref:Methylase involved in ubiquinone/menaquinone biosynthesis n=1 Tax=Desulfosporosinus youngiae DSM 17734 TaxID=768710 RepID=H5Y651_9FIRM|nr:class I SAM-dependent methyltransferase [Desulfosporosinus youngiae]EHQ91061.1 methylase involved in ubiquinone/menaquinone biosynthesis [Desulfosporosinus youngiae DSM 17734]